MAPFLGVACEELLQKAGYIEEVIDHKGFTENIYKDEGGNLIDMARQIKDMYEKDKSWANLAYLPEKYDALTEYVEEHCLHIIFVNNNKVSYPRKHPTYKKLTFAIAGELAHILLGHLLIPKILKTPEELNIEELEADEFASRFLNAEDVSFSDS